MPSCRAAGRTSPAVVVRHSCGLNGALYFVAMDADGGYSKYPTAGAKYGTGYCDAQCPHDLKWINGETYELTPRAHGFF